MPWFSKQPCLALQTPVANMWQVRSSGSRLLDLRYPLFTLLWVDLQTTSPVSFLTTILPEQLHPLSSTCMEPSKA